MKKTDRTEKARNEVPWKGISHLVKRVDSVNRANMLDNRQKVGDQRLDGLPRTVNNFNECKRVQEYQGKLCQEASRVKDVDCVNECQGECHKEYHGLSRISVSESRNVKKLLSRASIHKKSRTFGV
jgi:hypothetical protein